MALGAVFSAAEVIPLTFLTVEAWSFLQLGARQESKSRDAVPAPLGGDVPGRGRVLELPRRRDLRLPDQPADRLLLRDRHRADGKPRPRGDDGRLRDARRRPGPLLPALPDPGRTLARARRQDELLVAQHRPRLDVASRPCSRSASCSSTSRSTTATYEARTLEFLTNDTNTVLEWLRFPGDVLFIVGGVLPLLYICWLGVRYPVKRVTLEEPEEILFTEVTEPAAGGARPAMSALHTETAARGRLRGVPLSPRWPRPARRAIPTARSGRFRTAGFTYHASSTSGSARRASSCGVKRPITSGASPATAPGRRLQQVSGQGRLHRLGRGREMVRAAGPVAAFGGGALPSRHLGRAPRNRLQMICAGGVGAGPPRGPGPCWCS